MKTSIADQVEKTIYQIKGKVREMAGRVRGKSLLDVEGKNGQSAVGKDQKKSSENKGVLDE